MRIDAATPADVRHVAENMRESDEREFLAVNWVQTRAELVEGLVRRYAKAPEAIVARDNAHQPIAIGALIEQRPNVATLLFFATDRFPEIAVPLTRFIRRRLFPAHQRAGVHRIECAAADREDVRRWLEALGLSHEAEMRGYGKAGETFHQYAWVKPCS